MSDKKILLATPRGWCAGVDRAVEIVELALEKYGPPVYVRKQIVHNLHVVRSLENKGAIFVESEDEIPQGSVCVFSAHGVAPSVYENARSRDLTVVDATCPLVTKVHVEARRFARQDKTIFLIGHLGHEEVEGTSGVAPERTVVVESKEDVDRLVSAAAISNPDFDPNKVSFISQTTLAVNDTKEIADALKEKFPMISSPTKDDICYASQNRQDAVRSIAAEANLVLVVGSKNSSNSNRLVEVARLMGAEAYLVENGDSVDPEWVEKADVIGVSSGASTPEVLVEQVIERLKSLGVEKVEEVKVAEETIRFPLPTGLAH